MTPGTRTLGHGVGTLGWSHTIFWDQGFSSRTLGHGAGTRRLRLPEPVPRKPGVIRFSSRRRDYYYNHHDHSKNKHAPTRVLFHLVITVKLIYRGHQSFEECSETCRSNQHPKA